MERNDWRKIMLGEINSQKRVGRKWLIDMKWWKMSVVEKLWYGNQIERYIKKFGLTDDEAKGLKLAIAERGMREVTDA